MQSKRVSTARKFRKNPTKAERQLWSRLRDRQFEGLKFRRQHPIGSYVVDFACLEKKIVVEVDGGQHSESNRDAERDRWLGSEGYRVLRFWNNDVLRNLRGVLETIRRNLPSPSP